VVDELFEVIVDGHPLERIALGLVGYYNGLFGGVLVGRGRILLDVLLFLLGRTVLHIIVSNLYYIAYQ
jgi:hypothetical protein